MKTKTSRLLVIDASVVRSAGETNHPVSRACRETLAAVLTICHRVVVTETIREEWDKHQSRYSRKWRRSMAGRHKAIQPIGSAVIQIDTTTLLDNEREALEKDRCLIEAALAADRVIVTRDEALQKILAKTPEGPRLLHDVKWLNPDKNDHAELKNL